MGGMHDHGAPSIVEMEFSGELRHWRGPAPWHFVTVPDVESDVLAEHSPLVSYGWGMIPGTVRIGVTEWYTALYPKDGRYLVPVKAAVRRAENLEVGARPVVHLTIGSR